MKRIFKLALLLVICYGCMFILTGNAFAIDGNDLQQDSHERFAGTYTGLGLFYDGQFLKDDHFSPWKTTLNANGSGEIDWGDDNKGPITDWSILDGTLTIHAGISEITGLITDGVMLLDLGDDYIFASVGPNIDPELVNGSTLQEYLTVNPESFGYGPALSPEEIANTYYPVAFSDGEYCIASQNVGDDGVVTMNVDGTGSMITGTVENKLSWKSAGSVIKFYDESGIFPFFNGRLDDGILTVDMSETNTDGSVITRLAYFAAEGADLSGLSIITPEEYQALINK